MFTIAECRAQAEQKLAQAEHDDRHRKRLITAAEAWLAVALTEGRAAGTVFGLLKTTMSVQQALGPLLVVLLMTEGGRAGWVVLGALLLAAAMLSRRFAVGDLGLTRTADPVEVR